MNDSDKNRKCRLHDKDRPLTNGDIGGHPIRHYLCKQKNIHQK